MHRNRRVRVAVAGVALLGTAGIATANSDATDPPASTEAEGTTPVSTIATDDSTSAEPPVIDPGDGGDYEPSIDPANFVERRRQPLLPAVSRVALGVRRRE